MSLEGLFTDFKPTGMLGGWMAGEKQGADLGNIFANARSTNQQTAEREQKLPLDIAKMKEENSKFSMANDLTRSTQTPEYLRQQGETALNKSKVENLTSKQLQESLPIEHFDKMRKNQLQKSASIFTKAAERIEAGDYDGAFKDLMQYADNDEKKAAMMKEYQKYKSQPKAAAEYARNVARKAEWDIINTTPEKVFEMWKLTQENLNKLQQARVSASSSRPEPNRTIEDKLLAIEEEMNKYPKGSKEHNALLTRYNYLAQTKFGSVKSTDFNAPGIPQTKGPNIEGYPPAPGTAPVVGRLTPEQTRTVQEFMKKNNIKSVTEAMTILKNKGFLK